MGVFLLPSDPLAQRTGLPHARGGVSAQAPAGSAGGGSSPRTWGCFCFSDCCLLLYLVFPTHVGVFPTVATPSSIKVGLPHARGGVSVLLDSERALEWSSPRTWGCFYVFGRKGEEFVVFPTHVGVFPRAFHGRVPGESLPHARGGVSSGLIFGSGVSGSSPRTWGCFLSGFYHGRLYLVFPTHVGVFPRRFQRRRSGSGLPHARGGVSPSVMPGVGQSMSSPRTWGCF